MLFSAPTFCYRGRQSLWVEIHSPQVANVDELPAVRLGEGVADLAQDVDPEYSGEIVMSRLLLILFFSAQKTSQDIGNRS